MNMSQRSDGARASARRTILTIVVALSIAFGAQAFAETPAVGAKAPDFTLSTPVGKPVSLMSEMGKGSVVLVVLRGFPGYQCPYCEKQVHDFVDHASAFATKNARVLLVYPGPPADLNGHAKDFLTKQTELPANITLVVDPDYKMTDLYELRWHGEHETAYPSTFVLDRNGTVQFEKISHSHGDRTTAEEVLNRL